MHQQQPGYIFELRRDAYVCSELHCLLCFIQGCIFQSPLKAGGGELCPKTH